MEKANEYVDFGRKVQSDASNYINSVLAGSTNYGQRFITFLAFTQLLYLFLFIGCRVFAWFEWFNVIPVFIFICFGFGVVLLFLFLFKSVNARALSFFGSGTIYLILSIFFARGMGMNMSFYDLSFLGGLAVWNIIYSIIILMIGTARTFLLGILQDYGARHKK